MVSRERRKSRGIFRGLVNWFLSFFEELVPTSQKLEASIGSMLDALNAEADAASMAMALAEQTRGKLQGALAEVDEFDAAVSKYITAGDDNKARQAIVLKNEADARLQRLTEDYKRQQADAEHLAAKYATSKQEVDRRKRELPQLKADVRIAEAEAKMVEARGKYNLDAATEEFDAVKGDIERQRLSARARATLDRDPLAEVREGIRADAAQADLERQLDEYKKRADTTGDTAATETPQLTHSPAEEARLLLDQPRYAEFAKRKVHGGK